MFQADNVAESLQCNSRKPEVTKLPVAVQIGGIENDMIMNMCPIHMGCHDKSVLPLTAPSLHFSSQIQVIS